MLMCFPKIYIVFCDRAARSWLARGVPRPQIVMAGVSDSKTSDLNYEARVPKKSKIRLMIHVYFFSFLSNEIHSILRSAADPPIGLDATDPGF